MLFKKVEAVKEKFTKKVQEAYQTVKNEEYEVNVNLLAPKGNKRTVKTKRNTKQNIKWRAKIR